ncbi:permease-like cell division protein FtsX [Microbispora sp. H10830]|uniref:permease-like cell division protein FtsX n=1 Tax=Microbispora sp. H10830 TaxID=2729109 RepID=UPI0015FFE6F3|nr:permease-like cell division protein FtsX [Microbispora sp. H10830]
MSDGTEPRSSRSRLLWIAGPLVVAVLIAAAWGLPRLLAGPPQGPLPPPPGPWPTTGTFEVSVGSATEAEKRAVIAALEARPDVREVKYQSAEQEWKEYQESRKLTWSTSDDPLHEWQREDMTDSIVGVLLDRSKSREFSRAIRALPGVDGVYPQGDGFWYGKTHVTLRLCLRKPIEGTGCREPLTTAQQDAIVKAVRGTPEVEAFYFEDPEHATKDLRARTDSDFTAGVSYYHLKLKDPEDVPVVIDRFRGMEGLWQARPVERCLLC